MLDTGKRIKSSHSHFRKDDIANLLGAGEKNVALKKPVPLNHSLQSQVTNDRAKIISLLLCLSSFDVNAS